MSLRESRLGDTQSEVENLGLAYLRLAISLVRDRSLPLEERVKLTLTSQEKREVVECAEQARAEAQRRGWQPHPR